MTEKEKFYQKNWFMYLMLILITPVGLFLLWRNKKLKTNTKWILTVVFSVWFIIIGVNSQETEEEKAENEAKQEKREEEQEKKEQEKKEQEKKEQEEKEQEKKEQEEKEQEKKEQQEKETKDKIIKEKIINLVEDESGVKLNKVEVVKNLSDDADGGYNALVHLVFDSKNRAKTAKGAINAVTDKTGANLAGTVGLENVTFFWEVPYLLEDNNIVKINAEQKEDKMYRVDEWFDGRIFE
ncbi:MAG TPA: hypothetical protein VK094_08780 [Pseudogracilibacillus sp.]|nr:hypothetical protein [Pseudogracilibacillus sp.]